MKKITINETEFDFCESWGVLRQAQDDRRQAKDGGRFEVVSRLSCLGAAEMKREGYELLIKNLLGASDKFWEKLVLGLDEWESLKNLASWVFETPLDVKPFDFLRVGRKKYYLPEPEFGFARALEISMGSVYMTQYANGDIEALDWLLAVFCREKSGFSLLKTSRRPSVTMGRVMYRDEDVEPRALDLAKAEGWERAVAGKYIIARLTAFYENYKEMFGGDDLPKYGDGSGWLYVLKNVAKAGYFRSVDEVGQSEAAFVWGLMLDDTLDQKRATKKN